MFARGIGIIRPAKHARRAGSAEIEGQRVGPIVPQSHVDGGGVALDVIGLTVFSQRVVFEIADAGAFTRETHVEQNAPQPANVLRNPAFVGPEFTLPLTQLPLVQVWLQGPLVEKIAGSDLNDHENDESQAQQQRDGDEQPLRDVGIHGGVLDMQPGGQ